MVIDEWETAEQFHSFFAAHPKIGDVMGSIGMSGPPTITVYESVDAPGTV
jgi:formylmethanofuran dehydrogenase subunit E